MDEIRLEKIKYKYNQIISSARKEYELKKSLRTFALTDYEMGLIKDGSRLGFKLVFEFDGESIRIPFTRMRF